MQPHIDKKERTSTLRPNESISREIRETAPVHLQGSRDSGENPHVTVQISAEHLPEVDGEIADNYDD